MIKKNNREVPVIGFVSPHSNSGKTTLITKVISLFKQQGVRVGVIKHAHHGFDLDTPGKDSYKMRESGAVQVMVASSKRWALMMEKSFAGDAEELEYLFQRLEIDELDLVIVEGFKEAAIPKIEICRPSLNSPMLIENWPPERVKTLVAVACDEPHRLAVNIPVLDLNSPAEVVSFIVELFTLN